MKKKILVVEDDVSILTGIVDLLNGEGYEVFSATNGVDALVMYKHNAPNLVVLDVMIPQKSGYEVCQEIRRKNQEIPILMLTAKGQEVDKVVGLELGADDYMVKPFGINELLARIRALFRRTQSKMIVSEHGGSVEFGNITIDGNTMTGSRGSQSFSMTKKEYLLIKILFDHQGEVLDRITLLDQVWGIEYSGTTRTLDQHIAKLRQKIEENPTDPKHIITVHGVGYGFQS